MVVAIIRLYQMLLAPLLPPNTCRFYPTCSSYAIEAIQKHGAWRGMSLAIRRILRCHPFNDGGEDPVP